jgi:molecular chaperone DnaK
MGKVVGIDLGTTNSVIAVLEGERPEVISNLEGGRTTPSVVAFRDNERLVGQLAKRQSVLNPERTFYSVKRFIGRRFDEVSAEMKLVPYQVVQGAENTVKFVVDDKQYAPEEISAQVLRKLADDAGKF